MKKPTVGKSNLVPAAKALAKPSRADQARAMVHANPNVTAKEIMAATGLSERNSRAAMAQARHEGAPTPGKPVVAPKKHVTLEADDVAAVASSCDDRIQTVDDLLRVTKVDLAVWEIERHVVNKWEVAMKQENANGRVTPIVEPLFQIKIWLRRKKPLVVAAQDLLAKIKESAPLLAPRRLKFRKLPHRRALELCIMDPHIGLLCHQPEADAPWDIDLAAATILAAIDDLVEKAKAFGPFEQAFMPFGNDFTHADNVFHTTTAGTGQPEAIAWHHVYVRAQGIAIEMVNRLRPVAKEIYIYEVPGNHSRMADFTLALLLQAYFRHDKGVHVDAGSSPYKFHRYGNTLIGYEHGHSVSQIRLAALMANERRSDFAETEYREWHLGDQHRKGSSNPAALEEQGVSVEFIPGLTAPNEWHRLKAFNHQKRGAVAWVYDFAAGPVARFQHNISQYSHTHLKAA